MVSPVDAVKPPPPRPPEPTRSSDAQTDSGIGSGNPSAATAGNPESDRQQPHPTSDPAAELTFGGGGEGDSMTHFLQYRGSPTDALDSPQPVAGRDADNAAPSGLKPGSGLGPTELATLEGDFATGTATIKVNGEKYSARKIGDEVVFGKPDENGQLALMKVSRPEGADMVVTDLRWGTSDKASSVKLSADGENFIYVDSKKTETIPVERIAELNRRFPELNASVAEFALMNNRGAVDGVLFAFRTGEPSRAGEPQKPPIVYLAEGDEKAGLQHTVTGNGGSTQKSDGHLYEFVKKFGEEWAPDRWDDIATKLKSLFPETPSKKKENPISRREGNEQLLEYLKKENLWDGDNGIKAKLVAKLEEIAKEGDFTQKTEKSGKTRNTFTTDGFTLGVGENGFAVTAHTANKDAAEVFGGTESAASGSDRINLTLSKPWKTAHKDGDPPPTENIVKALAEKGDNYQKLGELTRKNNDGSSRTSEWLRVTTDGKDFYIEKSSNKYALSTKAQFKASIDTPGNTWTPAPAAEQPKPSGVVATDTPKTKGGTDTGPDTAAGDADASNPAAGVAAAAADGPTEAGRGSAAIPTVTQATPGAAQATLPPGTTPPASSGPQPQQQAAASALADQAPADTGQPAASSAAADASNPAAGVAAAAADGATEAGRGSASIPTVTQATPGAAQATLPPGTTPPASSGPQPQQQAAASALADQAPADTGQPAASSAAADATPQAALPVGADGAAVAPAAPAGQSAVVSVAAAQAQLANSLDQDRTSNKVTVSDEDQQKQLFQLDSADGAPPVTVTSGASEVPASVEGQSPVRVETVTYKQTYPDGRTRTISRSQTGEAEPVWSSSTTQGKPGKAGYTGSEVKYEGRDGRTRTTISADQAGVVTENIETRTPSAVVDAAPAKFQPFYRTVRTTTPQEGGKTVIEENKWGGKTPEAASDPDSAPFHSETTVTKTVENLADGRQRLTTSGARKVTNNGAVSETTSSVSLIVEGGKTTVDSLNVDYVDPTGVRAHAESKGGEEVQYTSTDAKGNTKSYDAANANQLPPEQLAAVEGLRRSVTVELLNIASGQSNGLDSAATLLGIDKGVTAGGAARARVLQERLIDMGGKMVAIANNPRLKAGVGAMAVFDGVMGIYGLARAGGTGDAYAISEASVGAVAGFSSVTQFGSELAATRAVGKAAGVAGEAAEVASEAAQGFASLGRAAGAVATSLTVASIGMSSYDLAQAIKSGDTKAIVSSSVNIAGSLGGLVAGTAVGGPVGLAIGAIIAVGVIAFTELWNKLFNPGTPITGPDPTFARSPEVLSQVIKHAGALFDNFGLTGDGSSDKFEDWRNDQSLPQEVRDAAQFFFDNPEYVNWMDAAGTGDIEERDARYHGSISYADLNRFLTHVAIPPEVYNNLPPPSNDARLWSAGVIHQDFGIIEGIGKDGQSVWKMGTWGGYRLEGQGVGDNKIGMGELVNFASGTFDDRIKRDLRTAHPDLTEEQLQQRFQNLKSAVAYMAFNASENRYLDGYDAGGGEDNKIGARAFAYFNEDNRQAIEAVMAANPNGLPSINALGEANTALGFDNPAIWRPDAMDQPNSAQPQSYYQVIMDNAAKVDSDGTVSWEDMAQAREKALQDKQYSLYYSLDWVMRNGGDIFSGRGEGRGINLQWSDIASNANRMLDAGAQSLTMAGSPANTAAAARTAGDFLRSFGHSEENDIRGDLQVMASGQYRRAAGWEKVPDNVRQAALYFIQHPQELSRLTHYTQQGEDGAASSFKLADLVAAGVAGTPWSTVQAGGVQPQKPTDVTDQTPENDPHAWEFGPDGPSNAQRTQLLAFVQSQFAQIDSARIGTVDNRDNQFDVDDLTTQRQRYLAAGNYKGAAAMDMLLTQYDSLPKEGGLVTWGSVLDMVASNQGPEAASQYGKWLREHIIQDNVDENRINELKEIFRNVGTETGDWTGYSALSWMSANFREMRNRDHFVDWGKFGPPAM